MKSPALFLDQESGDGMSDVQKVEDAKLVAIALRAYMSLADYKKHCE
jgi:hypothetical protein